MVVAALAACGGTTYNEPEPEFDDLDVDLGRSDVLGPPRIIDAERLARVLEGLPYETAQQAIIDGVTFRAKKILRRAKDGEPGGIVEYVDMSWHRGQDQIFRFFGSSFFAAEPPHRLLGAVGNERADGSKRTLIYRNKPDGMLIEITTDGVAEPPIRMPRSRSTVAKLAALYVDPELLEVGAMQTFSVFRAEDQRDRKVRLTVVAIGTVRRGSEEVATVTFEQDIEGAVTRWIVAGGRDVIQYQSGRDRTTPIR